MCYPCSIRRGAVVRRFKKRSKLVPLGSDRSTGSREAASRPCASCSPSANLCALLGATISAHPVVASATPPAGALPVRWPSRATRHDARGIHLLASTRNGPTAIIGLHPRLRTMNWDESVAIPADAVQKTARLRGRIQRVICVFRMPPS